MVTGGGWWIGPVVAAVVATGIWLMIGGRGRSVGRGESNPDTGETGAEDERSLAAL